MPLWINRCDLDHKY